MTNKVMIEIDIDSILTASDKAAALYKVVKEDVLSRGNIVSDIRQKIVDDLVKEASYVTLKEKISLELEKAYSTPDDIPKLIAGKHYELSGLVAQIMKERKDLLENEVLRYMAKSDFRKNISQLVERNLTARVERLIMPERDED